jgi:hypothetical protein
MNALPRGPSTERSQLFLPQSGDEQDELRADTSCFWCLTYAEDSKSSGARVRCVAMSSRDAQPLQVLAHC